LYFLDLKGIAKEEFYRVTGISASNFKGSGLKSDIGGDKIVKILSCYQNLNPEWLLTKIGSVEKNNSNFEVKEHVAVFPVASVTLNVLVVTPTGNVEPLGRPLVCVVVWPEQLSVPTGAV